ncbi:MAG: hypothetical protein K6E52_06695 [Bacteroidaceae bacterium]|nr:hypothetical protein [Bacteroidaceae bacterium]
MAIVIEKDDTMFLEKITIDGRYFYFRKRNLRASACGSTTTPPMIVNC